MDFGINSLDHTHQALAKTKGHINFKDVELFSMISMFLDGKSSGITAN